MYSRYSMATLLVESGEGEPLHFANNCDIKKEEIASKLSRLAVSRAAEDMQMKLIDQ